MIKGIRQYFDSHIQSVSGGRRREEPERTLQLAAAALLFEVAHADFHVAAEERRAVAEAVRKMFGLSPMETEELVALAEGEMQDATSLYEFTRLINEHFDHGQKLQMVEKMWQVAFVDRDKDKYEEHLIRKVCDLIYISHGDFVRLRERQAGS